jgi:LuxR family maltose regulon positive regulatory protein
VATPGQKTTGAVEVVESKLAVPSVRPGLVSRRSLLRQLASVREARVISVVAPAGYGKTTLLAQWAARDRRPFAWLSLEHRDNDPAVLSAQLAAALDRIEPTALRALTAARRSTWTAVLPRLVTALASTSGPIVLVLDDVHHLHDRDCLELLAELAGYVPIGSQLVLGGRSALPAIARIRASGELVEVGSRDLALSDAEAQRLLSAARLQVDEAEVSDLNARAEGWAAGLYLAALSRQERAESPAPPELRGDDRYVTDYLRSEHLSRLTRREVRFLIRSSVLERMSGPICDAVLERNDSARMLEALERRNLFVVALDRSRRWYRFHRLFRDMLRSELERREPELVAELHRRASAWYERNGLPEAAVEHASAAGDLEGVARLVCTAAFPAYRSGRVATVERWLALFDDPALRERYPAVSAIGAWTYYGVYDLTERWADAVERSRYDGPMPDGSASLRPWAAVVRTMRFREGLDGMRADAELALAELPSTSPWRATALFHLAASLLFTGEIESADAVFGQAADALAAAGGTTGLAIMQLERALLAMARDDIAAAEALVAEARELIEGGGPSQRRAEAILLAASARLAVRLGRPAEARDDVVRAERLRAELRAGPPWFSLQVMLELARSHLALADVDGAKALYRESQDVLRRHSGLGTLVGQLDELGAQLTDFSAPASGWVATLTDAELRLLPFLGTHLTFREIGERLFVSRNTVKTQAISVYRKLGASSRSQAIDRAAELGLVEIGVVSPRVDFTPTG